MGEIGRPTAKQLATLAELEAKPKLTEKQQATLLELQAKRDAKPSLSAGAKAYCKKWLKFQLFGKKADLSNKYTEKGVTMEGDAIAMVCRVHGLGNVVKNEQRYENDWAEGTPDMLYSKVGDTKCSWAIDTFPLFDGSIPDKRYEWQVQTYMWLTGLQQAEVHYCLVSTPEALIDYEANKVARAAGYDEVEYELYEEVRTRLTYDDIPEAYRIKTYQFDRDEVMIEQIKGQVELCRNYIETELLPLYNSIQAIPLPSRDNSTLSDADKALLLRLHNNVNGSPVTVVDKM